MTCAATEVITWCRWTIWFPPTCRLWFQWHQIRTGSHFGGRRSPDEVEQGVGRGHDGTPSQPVALHLRPHAGFDDDDEHDADHHGDEGGPQVVGDGQDAHPTAGLGLHGRQAGHQAAGRQRAGQRRRPGNNACLRPA